MILLLSEFLKKINTSVLPDALSFYSTRMVLSALTALLLSLFLGPYFIRKLYELKIGQTIRTDACPLLGKLHEKKQDTPTMGGILILFSMCISLLLWMDLTHPFTYLLSITTLFLGAVGARDDYLKLKYKNTKGMSGKKKLGLQLILSIFIACYLFIPTFGEWIQTRTPIKSLTIKEAPLNAISLEKDSSQKLSLQEYAARLYIPFSAQPLLKLKGIFILLGVLFMFLVIAGASNAVNLSDGLDGLAAGCLMMAAGALAIVALASNHIEIARHFHLLYIEGSGEIAIYLCALIGACLGFLWYNGYPAQVFMGDTGSLTLGGILGVSAILLRKEFFLAIVGGIFVIEAFSVILQVMSFRFFNKRIFLCAPLHHHFEYKGWPETKVVIRFWIIGLLLALIGLASLKFQ